MEYNSYKDVQVDHLKKESKFDSIQIYDGFKLKDIISAYNIKDMDSIEFNIEYDYDSTYLYLKFEREETDDEFNLRVEAYQKEIYKKSTPQYKKKKELRDKKRQERMRLNAEAKLNAQIKKEAEERELYIKLHKKYGSD